MMEFEKVLKTEQPDWVVVVGDVNATCACSITARKEGVKVAHIDRDAESGLSNNARSQRYFLPDYEKESLPASVWEACIKIYPPEFEAVMAGFYKSLNERDRRMYAGIEAFKLGHGGQNYIAKILGCSKVCFPM